MKLICFFLFPFYRLSNLNFVSLLHSHLVRNRQKCAAVHDSRDKKSLFFHSWPREIEFVQSFSFVFSLGFAQVLNDQHIAVKSYHTAT